MEPEPPGVDPLAWLRRRSVSPVRLGTLIAGASLAGLFAGEVAFDRLSVLARDDVRRNLRVAIVHCLLAGYLPAVVLLVTERSRARVLALSPVLEKRDRDREVRSVGHYPRRSWLLAALLGITLAATGPYLVAPVPETPWVPTTWGPEVGWHRVLGPFIGWWLAWLCLAIVRESIRFWRLAGQVTRLDLLDLDPIAPFSQQGLTNALAVVGFASASSLFLLDQGFAVLVAAFVGGAVTLGAVGLLLPVLGIRERIHAAKEEELIWARRQLRRARDSLTRSPPDGDPGKLADLEAYRRRVREIPDWPLAVSTYRRFGLYLLVPVATWIAATVLQVLVQTLLL